MSNAKLRRTLSNLLKKNNIGKLYSCNKKIAYRFLNASTMRSMISFLINVKPGMVVYE